MKANINMFFPPFPLEMGWHYSFCVRVQFLVQVHWNVFISWCKVYTLTVSKTEEWTGRQDIELKAHVPV